MRRVLYALRELLNYRELVAYQVSQDLKVRYRGTVLGFLWSLANPLLMTLVLWAVFSRIGRMNERNYALFLLSGLMVWSFFSQSLTQGIVSIIRNRALIQKIYVPKLVFPVTVVASNVVNLGFFILAYIIIAMVSDGSIPWTAVAAVPVLFVSFFVVVGVSLIGSTLNVFFRDMEHLIAVGLRALFYLTPLIYRPEMLGPTGKQLLQLNPMYYPVVSLRAVLYDGHLPGTELWVGMLVSAAISLVVGLTLFVSLEDKFVYYA
ncbi:MAG: ABC transporter permease [Myxococcota bacterium]